MSREIHFKDADACRRYVASLRKRPPEWLAPADLERLIAWIQMWEAHWMAMANVLID